MFQHHEPECRGGVTHSPADRRLSSRSADLQPDPRNARTHPKRQIEQLCASIRQFGFTNPVLVDEAGVLIAGHGRLRAAKEIGLPTVPVIELAGLTEAQKKALRLADNKIALNAGWDLEILKLELAEIGSARRRLRPVADRVRLAARSTWCSRLPTIPTTRSFLQCR